MKHNASPQDIAAAKAAVVTLENALTDLTGRKAELADLRNEAAALETLLASERGAFDPQTDSGRTLLYSQNKTKLELLTPWIAKIAMRSQSTDAIESAVAILADKVNAIVEPRCEPFITLEAGWRREVESASQGVLGRAGAVLSRKFPRVPDEYGFAPLLSWQLAEMNRCCQPVKA